MFMKFAYLLLIGCTLICAQLDTDLINAEIPQATDNNGTTSTSTTTTTTTSTTTTTAKPSSTSTTTTVAPVTTTTPAPAPYPEPSIGAWNSSCIMIKMAVQLNITYETKDNGLATALYNVPKDAVVDDSSCELNTTQSIQLNWGSTDVKESMLLQFDKGTNMVNMTMLRFSLYLTPESFPNAKANQSLQLVHRGFDFSVPYSMSYHCTRAQQFNLTETIDNKTVIGHVTLRDVQTEAFRTSSNNSNFSVARDCDSSQTSDIVPIAVGIALVALILIVLVSYLCARRRSTLRGYMSF